MINLDQILAKSSNYGNITLFEHTSHVVAAIRLFATKYLLNFNIELAVKGAVIHDLGKAHPYFQRKIKKINEKSLNAVREWNYVHRHEISSMAFLPCFDRSEWDSLIDFVIAHHKSISNDSRGRGILDLVERERNLIENHLGEWDEWSPYGIEIIKLFGFQVKPITKEHAKNAIKYVIDYCENKKLGFSPLRGLLKSADHFASAFMNETESKLKPLFEIPNLSFYHDEKRQCDIFPLSQLTSTDLRKHTLVVASTGAGKTDFLLRRCKGRIFYTLPFQASINAMWERISEAVHSYQPEADVRILHSTSKIVANGNDEQILQPLAGSSVKILTPHQLSAIIFGTSGFETVMLDIQGTDVILDEIHTYSDFSRSMVLEIVKALLRLDCRIHVGTATMPSSLYNQLLSIMGGKSNVYEVTLPEKTLNNFDRHQVDKIEDESLIPGILKEAIEKKEKVLMVFNTVNKAQSVFKNIVKDYPHIPKMLIHSRFKRGDRVQLEKKLKTEFNGDESKEFGKGLSPCLVVSTQVVEVSLDISFDRMITECAPLDSMIQRFGRVNRKRSKDSIGKFKPVHIIKPTGNVLPYKMEILKSSFDQLPENFEVLHERMLQDKIDNVYPVIEPMDIDVHLIYRNDKYLIKELTDNKKVLIEALEIESATCILETDREKYLTANWEDRLYMEIPINYRTISRHKSNYEQLEVGAYPFVVPQSEDIYKIFGLQLINHDNFL